MKNFTKYLPVLVGIALLSTSTLTFAYRATGTLKDVRAQLSKMPGPHTDSHAQSHFWTENRNDGTKWEWKWGYVYPTFTQVCGGQGGCSPSMEFSQTQAWATMVGLSLTGSLSPGLTSQFQRTFTFSQTFSLRTTINLLFGETGYGGVIQLARQQINAPIYGRWTRTTKACTKIPLSLDSICQYRWSNSSLAASWNGIHNTYHRTYVCGTKTTLIPTTGKLLPASCFKPELPAGYWGG